MKNFLRTSLMTAVVAGLMLVGAASSVQAEPFLTGGFSKVGNYLPVNGVTGAPTNLGAATGIDFLPIGGLTPTPGVAGQILVTNSSGNFLALTPFGTMGTIRDFSFAGLGSAAFPLTPLGAFETVGGVTFDLLTVSIFSQDDISLELRGTGLFHAAGFMDTPGTFVATFNTTAGTFSFSASQGAVPQIPEPASMLLLGTGLAGLGGALRKRLKK